MKKSILFALGLALLAASPASAKMVDGRYVAPGGEFSIAMQATADKLFKLDKEASNADIVLIDLQYARSDGLADFAQRTIEWIRLDAPVPDVELDRHAADTVTGYLEGRLTGDNFIVTDRRKQRNESGQLIYTFAATGTMNGTPSAWHGVLLFFGGGVALVSQLSTNATQPMLDADGITDAELASWASTVHPGP